MSIAVTGATGLLGRAVVEYFNTIDHYKVIQFGFNRAVDGGDIIKV